MGCGSSTVAEKPPAINPVPTVPAPAKYAKERRKSDDEESLFCDDGCQTVATTNDIDETGSAHRYVDYIQRERRSVAQNASEPSAIATAIAHRYRVTRAFVKYGINGEADQYQEEVDRAVPFFSDAAKKRVEEWMSEIIQAPPRGTRNEKQKVFKMVPRGSVVSLSGASGPDMVAKKRPQAHAPAQDDVLDDILANSNCELVHTTTAYDLNPEILAPGTVVGIDRPHGNQPEYDLVVIEEDAVVFEDDMEPKSPRVRSITSQPDLSSPKPLSLNLALSPVSPGETSESARSRGSSGGGVLDRMSVSSGRRSVSRDHPSFVASEDRDGSTI